RIVKLIVVPAGALTKPVPSLTLTWPVRVWFVLTSFVACSGEIWMFASTQFFDASTLSPARPSPLERVNDTPLTTTVVESRTTVTPGVDGVICPVHEPVPPVVVQVLMPPTQLPGPDRIVNVMTVPSGAFVKVTPSFETFTWPVSVWFVPTAFAAVAGVI